MRLLEDLHLVALGQVPGGVRGRDVGWRRGRGQARHQGITMRTPPLPTARVSRLASSVTAKRGA